MVGTRDKGCEGPLGFSFWVGKGWRQNSLLTFIGDAAFSPSPSGKVASDTPSVKSDPAFHLKPEAEAVLIAIWPLDQKQNGSLKPPEEPLSKPPHLSLYSFLQSSKKEPEFKSMQSSQEG